MQLHSSWVGGREWGGGGIGASAAYFWDETVVFLFDKDLIIGCFFFFLFSSVFFCIGQSILRCDGKRVRSLSHASF